MNRVDFAWAWGRPLMGGPTALMTRLRVYGRDRIPRHGGLVIAYNHFSWIDIPAFGWSSPRSVYFLAKAEAHAVPVGGAYLRLFGSFGVRRGESDREAVRRMRDVVRAGHALGIFAEGTRQRSGVPGPVQPGAAMAALQEDAPVVCAAIYGSHEWRPGNFQPVSIAYGEPLRFRDLPVNAKGYRAASEEIEQELKRLWEWLRDLHAAGRPRNAVPPRAPEHLRGAVTLP
ncbi:MAG TPA: lysophospholipid acyltransferase family protein [Gaiellaceae bacterium]|nr:lysophospholipid acyltransferase family protein [Gaiellaceae bacterium]